MEMQIQIVRKHTNQTDEKDRTMYERIHSTNALS